MTTQTEAKQRAQAHRVWLANQAGHVDPHERKREPVTTPDELSAQQRAVLVLVAQGCTNMEIARALCISDQTVKNHCTAIFKRLPLADGGNRRLQAALWYLRQEYQS
jgi:DNA-binding NarL/FixJ family response regulator